MNKQETKKIAKKVWWFIWESNSVWSWIVNIILAFIIIKFLVYPGLGLILTTSHPIVAVVSGSMEHDGSFDQWWDSPATCGNGKCTQEDYYKQYNITKKEFLEFKFKNGFNKGEIIVLVGTLVEEIKVGDIIVFQAYKPDPIIHRVTKKWEEDDKYYFQTKGDHNTASFAFEAKIPEERYVGRAVVKVPYLGYIKIGFVQLIRLFIQ